MTTLKSFEEIKQISETGNEFWSARDLQKPLGYGKWENFSKVIDRAMLACDTAGFEVKNHFPAVKKTVGMPVGEQFGSRGFPDVRKTPNAELGFPDIRKTKNITDYRLSRYASRRGTCRTNHIFFRYVRHVLRRLKMNIDY